MGQYFFMFSNGIYSDYCVGGLYVCDHKVAAEDWEAHKKEVAEFRKQHEELAMLAYSERTGIEPVRQVTQRHNLPPHVRMLPPEGWYGSVERTEFVNRDDIFAQPTFIAKHNMVQVEYEEMWED